VPNFSLVDIQNCKDYEEPSMSFERIHPSSSQTPQTASGPSQFASRSLPAPAPKRPRDQEDVNGLWIQRMEGAKARSNLLEILIRDVQTAQAAEPATGSVASVQPKLTIGQPNDHYEQEADRVAERVINTAIPAAPNIQQQAQENPTGGRTNATEKTTPILLQRQATPDAGNPIQSIDESRDETPQLQRSPNAAPHQVQTDLEHRLNASKGGGSPLPDEVRSFMEPRFKSDFKDVRVHTGGDAIQMNRELNAQAFTHKQDVYFGAGTMPGNNLLTAHELTHVIQQTSAANSPRASQTPVVQCRFSTIHQNLTTLSRQRSKNAEYQDILTLLNQGIILQRNILHPSISDCNQMLGLITQIEAKVQGAKSTKLFGVGTARNKALQAMNQSLQFEKDQIQQVSLNRLQQASAANFNADPIGYTGALPGLGRRQHNLVSTAGQQGASGSYFDRRPVNGTAPGRLLGIFKPESQEGGARNGRDKRGAGAIREVLGDTLDQSLGLGVVPRTRLIAMISDQFDQFGSPGSNSALQVGSYQKAVSKVKGDIAGYMQDAAKYKAFDVNRLQRIAILDMMSLNKDRHGGNIMFNKKGKLSAIDQGEMAPSAIGYNDKFGSANDNSGWAWADLPESEQNWSTANRAIITNMDPEAEIDNLAQEAQAQSSAMASVTGQPAQDTHLSARSIAMMKYGARTLKLCTLAGLTPAQTETIYTKRLQARHARMDATKAHVKKTALKSGGGEFAEFVKATFFQDEKEEKIAQAKAALGQPTSIHADTYTYGCAACEQAWTNAMSKGLQRIAVEDPTKKGSIRKALDWVLMPSMSQPNQIPRRYTT
jgi:hypothetical protein